MPSYMKSTLSQMAMLSLIWILVFWWYSVVTSKSIDLPDRIVATISSVITLYVQSRTKENKNDPEIKKDNDSKPIVDTLIDDNLHDINNIPDVG